MSPADVAKLLQDALDTQSTIICQPNDDNLFALEEKLLDLLQTISYDRADGFHHVVRVMQTESTYMADHTGITFPIPKCLGLCGEPLCDDVSCYYNGGQQKAHQNGGSLQPCASGMRRWWRTRGRRCPLWSQSNLGQLLLDAWVQGIAYQENLQCDWQETGT